MGIAINPTTGTVAWTPTVSNLGIHEFDIIATDAAGNMTTQPLDVDVTRADLVRLRLDITDANGNPLDTLDVGDTFFLQVFVSDLRDSAAGVF